MSPKVAAMRRACSQRSTVISNCSSACLASKCSKTSHFPLERQIVAASGCSAKSSPHASTTGTRTSTQRTGARYSGARPAKVSRCTHLPSKGHPSSSSMSSERLLFSIVASRSKVAVRPTSRRWGASRARIRSLILGAGTMWHSSAIKRPVGDAKKRAPMAPPAKASTAPSFPMPSSYSVQPSASAPVATRFIARRLSESILWYVARTTLASRR
mmetsp:Transcript_49252/g.141349  ORF Transcript_49252/g.141349 Transcript_49252/m.141349 type:complete len:214 (+) Transcript_49252:1890-2531(+)